MSQLLQEAFDRVAQLPAEEQERLAGLLLAELDDEQEWGRLLALPESEEFLNRLAAEARADYRAGLTVPLNLEDL